MKIVERSKKGTGPFILRGSAEAGPGGPSELRP